MKRLAVPVLFITILLGLVSCSSGWIEKSVEIRSFNSTYGENQVLDLTLVVTFESGPFNMVELPLPAYNAYSQYKTVATAKQENGLLGPGALDEAVSIKLEVRKVFGTSEHTLYSQDEAIGPSGSSAPGYWSDGGRFLISFDSSDATFVKE